MVVFFKIPVDNPAKEVPFNFTHAVPSFVYIPGVTSPVVTVLYTVIPATCADKGLKFVVPVRATRGNKTPFVVDSISRMELAFKEVKLSPIFT